MRDVTQQQQRNNATQRKQNRFRYGSGTRAARARAAAFPADGASHVLLANETRSGHGGQGAGGARDVREVLRFARPAPPHVASLRAALFHFLFIGCKSFSSKP